MPACVTSSKHITTSPISKPNSTHFVSSRGNGLGKSDSSSSTKLNQTILKAATGSACYWLREGRSWTSRQSATVTRTGGTLGSKASKVRRRRGIRCGVKHLMARAVVCGVRKPAAKIWIASEVSLGTCGQGFGERKDRRRRAYNET